jgi:hypothetical protein
MPAATAGVRDTAHHRRRRAIAAQYCQFALCDGANGRSWHKPLPTADRSGIDAPGKGTFPCCRRREMRWLARRRSSETQRSLHLLLASPISATLRQPMAADDGRRQRRGPLATRCLCSAIHDAACCSVANPVTIVGFMSGIVTSTAYPIPTRGRIRYCASAWGCLAFAMPIMAHSATT